MIESGHARVAKAFILYREQRRRARSTKDILLDIVNTMDGYLKQSDWRVNENSNVSYSLGGLILYNSGAITANYWLDNIYSHEISEAHRNGEIHIHDLPCSRILRRVVPAAAYCRGFGGVRGKISSKPAKHLSTLIQQMVNFLGILQNEWAGAQAFSSFDTIWRRLYG